MAPPAAPASTGLFARRGAPALVFAALALLAAASTAWELWAHPRYTDRTTVQQLGQLASSGVGALAAAALVRRRRTNPTWLLLVWFLACGFLQDFGPPHGWVIAVADLSSDLVIPAFMHLVLAYPAGRLAGRPERAVVGVAYAAALLHGIGEALFATWVRSVPPSRHVSALHLDGFTRLWPDAAGDALDAVLELAALAGFGLLLAALWRARRRGGAVRAPLTIAATASAAVFGVAAFVELGEARYEAPLYWVMLALQASVPVALGLGLVAQRRARAVVADLVLALDRTPLEDLESTLAQALRDPELELRLLDADGRVLDGMSAPDAPPDASSPPPGGPPSTGRLVTPVLGHDGRLIAEIISTPRPDDHPDLFPAVAAAARFAIEAAAMTAQLRRQVEELHASRQRVVEAAAAERRRIERNLHDGAQQQLLALGMQLDHIRRRVRRDRTPAAASVSVTPVVDATVLDELDSAVERLRATLGELQVLARGVHPPILTARGLVPAVRSLVERIPAPIELRCEGERRAEPAVEAAAYYVVSEALGNALRHARAATVRVEVAVGHGAVRVSVGDDGRGGADATGDGLRGLADRAAAVGGSLRITSPAGGGTTVEARLPCE